MQSRKRKFTKSINTPKAPGQENVISPKKYKQQQLQYKPADKPAREATTQTSPHDLPPSTTPNAPASPFPQTPSTTFAYPQATPSAPPSPMPPFAYPPPTPPYRSQTPPHAFAYPPSPMAYPPSTPTHPFRRQHQINSPLPVQSPPASPASSQSEMFILEKAATSITSFFRDHMQQLLSPLQTNSCASPVAPQTPNLVTPKPPPSPAPCQSTSTPILNSAPLSGCSHIHFLPVVQTNSKLWKVSPDSDSISICRPSLIAHGDSSHILLFRYVRGRGCLLL